MIDVPREFWGRPEAFQRYLEAQGLSSKKNLDVSQFRAPDIDKGLPNIEPRLLAPLEKPRTKSAGYVRDFVSVSFEPNLFPPQPVSTVRWRGRGPGCPTITLVCNSISASKSKCGFLSDSKYWFRRTQSGHCVLTQSLCTKPYVCTAQTGDAYERIVDIDPDTCIEGDQYSGAYICSWETNNQSDFPFPNPAVCGGGTGPGCTVGPYNDFFYDSVAYTNEYTTAVLISNTEDALPDYAACFGCDGSSEGCSALISGQGCTCSAFANTSTNETSYTIRRFKYKFKFPNPGTDGYLKILWNETFKPTLSAGVTYCGSSYATGVEDPDPTHWTTSAMSEVFGSGDTEGSEHEVTEPSSNGTIYVTDIRWTKTEGCEPDASSIEGVDQFASNTSDTYLCNDRDPADKNCTCPA